MPARISPDERLKLFDIHPMKGPNRAKPNLTKRFLIESTVARMEESQLWFIKPLSNGVAYPLTE